MKFLNLIKMLFFSITSPIQSVMSLLKKPEPQMSLRKVRRFMTVLEPGDALFSYESWHFTNFFIPGRYDHAAIVVKVKNRLYVVEAVKPKVQRIPLDEWLKNKDKVKAFRRYKWVLTLREDAANYALQCVDYEYDQLFRDLPRHSIKKVTYCARLVANALKIPFTGVLEPVELMARKELKEILDSEKLKD